VSEITFIPKPANAVRADQLMVSSGVSSSRSLAQRLIAAGSVRVQTDQNAPERVVLKASELLSPSVVLRVADDSEARFVSRSGLKLDFALVQFGIDVSNQIVLDIGQSTGGFTDCVLCRGGSAIVGADVGHSQLHEKLAKDKRVLCLERVNLRDSEQAQWVLLQSRGWAKGLVLFDLVAIDVSFISVKHIIPQALKLVRIDGDVVILFKPQFEVGKGNIGSGGIVKTTAIAESFLQQMLDWLEHFNEHLITVKVMANPILSPITGTDGNQEYLIWIRRVS
jgi:23S rRNA (cytidine1920-2'-O)/16S rRNA (cytidine1409-2'-O)-methyltransferase